MRPGPAVLDSHRGRLTDQKSETAEGGAASTERSGSGPARFAEPPLTSTVVVYVPFATRCWRRLGQAWSRARVASIFFAASHRADQLRVADHDRGGARVTWPFVLLAPAAKRAWLQDAGFTRYNDALAELVPTAVPLPEETCPVRGADEGQGAEAPATSTLTLGRGDRVPAQTLTPLTRCTASRPCSPPCWSTVPPAVVTVSVTAPEAAAGRRHGAERLVAQRGDVRQGLTAEGGRERRGRGDRRREVTRCSRVDRHELAADRRALGRRDRPPLAVRRSVGAPATR